MDAGFSNLAARRMGKHLRAVRAELAGIKAAHDTECIHRARVASRRLRACMNLFGDCFKPKRFQRWRRTVRRLTRGLGPARDKDVGIVYMQHLSDLCEDAAARPGIARLLLRLQQDRATMQGDIIALLDRVEAKGVLDEFARAVKKLAKRTKSAAGADPTPAMVERAQKYLNERYSALHTQAPALTNPADIRAHHELRITAKRLRYTMEVFQDVYKNQLDAAIEDVRLLQQSLGDLHDCDVWQQVLEVFVVEERARSVAYFGNARAMKRLLPGLEHIRQDRHAPREEMFARAREQWQKIEQMQINKLWTPQQPPHPHLRVAAPG